MLKSIPLNEVDNCEFTGPFRIASQALPLVSGVPFVVNPVDEITTSPDASPSGITTPSINGRSEAANRFVFADSR